jgi:hypothetical protein
MAQLISSSEGLHTKLIPVIPFCAELQRIRETIEIVPEERIRL